MYEISQFACVEIAVGARGREVLFQLESSVSCPMDRMFNLCCADNKLSAGASMKQIAKLSM
jgi:hypothetical protein